MGVKVSAKWRKYLKTCKQVCSYVFIQENYIKAHVILQLVVTFYPPLHHNGKGSFLNVHVAYSIQKICDQHAQNVENGLILQSSFLFKNIIAI